MTRTLLILGLALGGCATVPNGSTSNVPSATTGGSVTAALDSSPPPAPPEATPALDEHEVWVPGYYEPYAGVWVWHTGRRTKEKSGYRIVSAQYRNAQGKFFCTPPHWLRADLAER